MSIEINHAQRSADRTPAFGRLITLGAILAMMAFGVAMGWHRQVSLEVLVRHRASIEELVAAHRAVAILAFITVYAAAVALSFPGAALLTVGGGVIFGAWPRRLAAATAGTLRATAICLVSKSACGCVAGCSW